MSRCTWAGTGLPCPWPPSVGAAASQPRPTWLRRSGSLVRDTQVIDGVSVTRAELRLVGTVAGAFVDVNLVYTRTWLPTPAGWEVVAAYGSVKAD